jgi:hypothetical protein
VEVVMADFICCSNMFVNLNVEPRCLGFWPSLIIHFNIVVLTFCGQLWQIRIRSHGLQVIFLVSYAVAQITAFWWNETHCLHAFWNETVLQPLNVNYVLKKSVLFKVNFSAFYTLWNYFTVLL